MSSFPSCWLDELDCWGRFCSLIVCSFLAPSFPSRRSSSFERMKRKEREGKNTFRPDDRRD